MIGRREAALFTEADFDVVFVVKDDRGERHAVFAHCDTEGGWHQWGAPREILSRNVPVVEAWAKAMADLA